MNFPLISLLHIRADQNKFYSVKFMLEIMTGLEIMYNCSFSFHYTVCHNIVVLHTFAQLKMNIKLY